MSELTIAIQNEYATLNVVSLDDLPIARSSRVLVQVVTVNRLTGRETRDATLKIGKGERAYEVAGEQIVRIGKPPFRIANSRVEIEFRSARFKTARVLDINGYPMASSAIGNKEFTMPKDAIYAVLAAGPKDADSR